jgi:hypothetical protein
MAWQKLVIFDKLNVLKPFILLTFESMTMVNSLNIRLFDSLAKEKGFNENRECDK